MPRPVMALFSQYLTAEEEAQLHQQFQGDIWRRNNQVLWSGILRAEAQRWADKHEMQTLTTAMGPLMDPASAICLKNQKSKDGWSKYIKGASALFAWYISKGESVTVLSPPPPEKFHPSGATSYQKIEDPIVRGKLGTSKVSRIEMAHPTVQGAENMRYQVWPVDETVLWIAKFGGVKVRKRLWRKVKAVKPLSNSSREIGIIIRGTKQCGAENAPISPHQEGKVLGKKRRKKEQKILKIATKENKIAEKEKKREEKELNIKTKEEKKITNKNKTKVKEGKGKGKRIKEENHEIEEGDDMIEKGEEGEKGKKKQTKKKKNKLNTEKKVPERGNKTEEDGKEENAERKIVEEEEKKLAKKEKKRLKKEKKKLEKEIMVLKGRITSIEREKKGKGEENGGEGEIIVEEEERLAKKESEKERLEWEIEQLNEQRKMVEREKDRAKKERRGERKKILVEEVKKQGRESLRNILGSWPEKTMTDALPKSLILVKQV